jgi:hypothetical protein
MKIGSALLSISFAILSACAVDSGQPAAESPDTDDQQVSVDGALYSRSELHERFGQQDLHWVITQEVLDSGIPAAFTSEDKRNSALGVQAVVALDATITTVYASLYEHNDRGGTTLDVTASGDLGNFNDKTSSIDTYTNDVVLYEHTGRKGCSLFVQRQKYIAALTGHDFCGLFTGNWNDKTSSVGITF